MEGDYIRGILLCVKHTHCKIGPRTTRRNTSTSHESDMEDELVEAVAEVHLEVTEVAVADVVVVVTSAER